jgi:hypothetical protein
LATASRLSACLTFDLDPLAVWPGKMHTTSPAAVSGGEFKKYAWPRIGDLLIDYSLRWYETSALHARRATARLQSHALHIHSFGGTNA